MLLKIFASLIGVVLLSGSAQSSELPQSPPGVETSTTAPMPLDLALAKKLPMPEPLKSLQKVIGTPGGAYAYHGDPPGDTMYRWYYDDCDDRESIGDVTVQAGQAVALWFKDCAGNIIVRAADGQFFSADEHGKTTWFAETAKEKATKDQVDQMEAKFRQERGVPCAMMALSIEAIAVEHFNYPDESRDELVAQFVAAALPGLPALHTGGQDMSVEQLIQRAGKFVDYVEAHSGLAPEEGSIEVRAQAGIRELKERFTADCTSGDLPW